MNDESPMIGHGWCVKTNLLIQRPSCSRTTTRLAGFLPISQSDCSAAEAVPDRFDLRTPYSFPTVWARRGLAAPILCEKDIGSASYQQTSDSSLLNIKDSQACLQVLSLRPQERSALSTRIMARRFLSIFQVSVPKWVGLVA